MNRIKSFDKTVYVINLRMGKIHGFALFNERTKLNLKYLLTSFSINFDHKLIVGERYVCVFVKVIAKWVDQRGRSACRQISFLDQFALGGRLLLSTRRRAEIFVSLTKSIFTAQQQQLIGEKLQKCLQSKLRASVCVLIT